MNKHIAIHMVRDYGVIAQDHPATDEPVLTQMAQRWRGGSEAKSNRWLGFVQGAMYARGVFTLGQLKDHSRRHCVVDGIGGIAHKHEDGTYWAQFPPIQAVARGSSPQQAGDQCLALVRNALGDGALGLRVEPMAEDGPITHLRLWALGCMADEIMDRLAARRVNTAVDTWETQITKKRRPLQVREAHLMDQAISIAERYRYHVDWIEDDKQHVGLCEEYPALSRLADTIAAARFGIFELVAQVVHDQLLAGETPAPPVRR